MKNSIFMTLKKSTRTAKFGLIIIAIWIISAIASPILSPYGPEEVDISKRLSAPSWVEGGAEGHFLGTDEMGRDVLSRIIYGSRISMIVGIMAVFVSAAIGITFGLLAGYYGGRVDSVIMRMVDVMMAFPFMFMALCLMAALGTGLGNLVLVLGITGWVPYTRTIRAQVLSLKQREFVIASETIGCTKTRTMFKHLLMNVLDSAIILATLEMATAILSEASLTFLGMGVPPSIPTWGQMVSIGRQYIFTAWWLTLFPGLIIFIVCLSINFVGDWIRDIRDPRLRDT